MAAEFLQQREESLQTLQETFRACMQCGTCSASCPHSASMDHPPRRLWRLILMGELSEIWNSRTFWLCSNCYACTLRCPRGLPLTEAVNTLKRLAPRQTLAGRREAAFYQVFMENVCKHGRVQEMGMMLSYCLRRRDPRVPLKFVPLGSRLLWQGKIRMEKPWRKGGNKLEQLFARARELEGESCATPITRDAP